MKFFWVDSTFLDAWDERKKIFTTALESGASAVVVREEDIEKARNLGNIKIVARSNEADIILKKDVERIPENKEIAVEIEIKGKEDERRAVKLADSCDYIVVYTSDWKVIPLENIIAELQKKRAKVVVGVENFEDAKLALQTLEIGADGVLLKTNNFNEIKRVSEIVTKQILKLNLKVAKVKKVRQVGMGDRVCVDTASLLKVGEGMLVGSQSSGLFLVHSETLESEYVSARPFRVNAGAVHAYILTPDMKTKYLCELSAGDEVLIVDHQGNARNAIVGRVKIERRPLILIEAEVDGKIYKTLLQNAETINLVDKNGKPISVARIKEGDEILIYVKESARHFGVEIEETIIEK